MRQEVGILAKMNSLLAAFRYCPLYRKCRLPFKDVQDFRKLPLINKDILRKIPWNPKEIPARITATSGTTESSLIIPQSKDCYREHVRRVAQTYERSGVKRGDVCLNLCAYEMNGGGAIMEEAFRTLGVTVIPFGIISNSEKLKQCCSLIKKYRPGIINSYTNQVYSLFEQLKNKHAVQKCIVNGEPLYPQYKENLQRCFGLEIYNNYGCMEFSGFAISNNPRSHEMEIFRNGLYIEVLDEKGQSKQEGEGRIVVTDLNNRCLPLIRYVLGDMVRIRAVKRASYITVLGRNTETILLDGEVYSKQAILEDLENILKTPEFFLVIKKNAIDYKDHLTLYVKGRAGASLSGRIRQWNIAGKMGNLFSIQPYQDMIPRSRTGKYRHLLDLRRKNE